MKTFRYKVYTLCSPDSVGTLVPFYVGVTSQKLCQRKAEHIRDARNRPKKNPVKSKYILDCLEKGIKIEIVLLREVVNDISLVDRLEQWYIENMVGLLNGPTKTNYCYSMRRTYHRDKIIC